MTGVRNRVEAFIDWGWDYLSRTRGPQVLDRTGMAEIDWGEDVSSQPAAERSTA
jgi:NADH dehydrogenase